MNRGNHIYKILIRVIPLVALLLSCEEEINEPKEPTPQDVELTVTYSGTAKSLSGVYYDVHLRISDAVKKESLIARDFSVTLEQLESGYTKKMFSGLHPGSYELKTWLDWNDDSVPDSYEPHGSPDPLPFEVAGFETVRLNVQLVDRTSPGDNGWIEGTITYNGSSTGYHHVYVRVTDLDFNLIVERNVTNIGLGVSQSQLKDGCDYICSQVPPGFYYALAYWDVNDNGDYDKDKDPRSDFTFPFIVSPGLPTVGIDFLIYN